jgi:hypothetical protein
VVSGAELIPVNLMTDALGKAISVPLLTDGPIAIAPDGQTAYVITGTGGSVGRGPDITDIAPMDLTTGNTGSPIAVLDQAIDIGISPNGRTVYVTTGNGPPAGHTFLASIDVGTGKPGKPMRIDGGSLTIAVAPGSDSSSSITEPIA